MICRGQPILIVLAIIALLLFSVVCNAGGAKCWKRTSWVPWTTLSGDGKSRVPVVFESGNPVCLAFEKVLNSTCESPKKLQWNWALPTREMNFKKYRWEILKWEENWELTKDMGQSNSILDKNKEHNWNINKDRIRSEYERGKIMLSAAKFDIDNDKQIEQVIRYDHVPPQEFSGTAFGVLNPITKQIDPKYNALNTDSYLCDSYEIMSYHGVAYRFGVDVTLNQLIIFDLKSDGDGKSSTDICHFRYIAKKGK
jgi:hypothetical protein